MNILARLLFVLGLCSVAMIAADARPGADVLNRWVGGKWVGDAHFLDTDYSKAGTGGGVSTCAWSPDHIFVVCDQDVKDNGRSMRFLSIYAFDPQTTTHHFYGLSPDSDRPRTGDLFISADGTRWEYLTKTTIKDKPVWFRTTNQFHGNDHVDWWSEFSTDGGKTWTKTGEGKESRE